jgi:thiamine biosynthesis lipoprotein
MSVTLVGENGAALDALATAALILGPERSVPLLTEQGMDAIFVTDQGQVLITRGLKNEFRLTNKTNTMSDGQVSVA